MATAPRTGVWVTRAEPGAGETAARVEALGLVPLVAPLLHVRPVDPAPGAVEAATAGAGALAFTSANGVRAFAAVSPRRDLRVFAVGDTTAQTATAAGFSGVVSAAGDVEALAAAILAAAPDGLVLHPRGRDGAGDLEGALAAGGVEARALVLYETVAQTSPPRLASEALARGDMLAVLVHSPKAARVLATVTAHLAADDLADVTPLALSHACAAPLAGLGLRPTRVAARKDEAALMEALVELGG